MQGGQRYAAVVTAITIEAQAVKRFRLEAADGQRLPGFAAGSHITTWVGGADGTLYERSYSLCSQSSNRRSYDIAIKRLDDGKGASRYWHEQVDVGTRLYISLPKCHFMLAHNARAHVFIAGGIGITPFLSMMSELHQRGAQYELHYVCKTQRACPFYDEIAEAFPHSQFYFSRESTGQLTPQILAKRPLGTHVYVCGPERMLHMFSGAATALGYPRHNLHVERFSSVSNEQLRPFTAILAQSGRQVTVSAQRTLLEVLLEEGLAIPHACRVGGCGSCEVAVLEGDVLHRDFYLPKQTQAEGCAMLACVSRAKGSSITLDL